MNLPAWFIAAVRTGIQSLIAWLFSSTVVLATITWIEANIGISITPGALEVVAFGIAITLVTAAINYLGKLPQFQWLNKLVSLFLSNSAAVYDKTPAAGGEGLVEDEVAVDMGGEDIPADRG